MSGHNHKLLTCLQLNTNAEEFRLGELLHAARQTKGAPKPEPLILIVTIFIICIEILVLVLIFEVSLVASPRSMSCAISSATTINIQRQRLRDGAYPDLADASICAAKDPAQCSDGAVRCLQPELNKHSVGDAALHIDACFRQRRHWYRRTGVDE